MVVRKLRQWFGGLVGESDARTTQNLFYLFLVAFSTIVVVFGVTFLVMHIKCVFPPTSPSSCSVGEIGDFFGGILNPILTFLAFMGLLITIAVQKDELSQTRSQLASAASAQVEIAELQKKGIENSTIYGLLGALRDTACLLYTSPSPRDKRQSRMPSSA